MKVPDTFIIIVVLLVAGGITQGVRLSSPHQVVFDEVHFGKFVSAYCCTHERFFDIHPPHGKLLIAAAAKMAGYDGSFPFERIGQPYGSLPIGALRALPALAGMILPLIIFVLIRQLGGSAAAGLLGGLAITFDNALTVQTRFILLDAFLLVATFGSLAAFLAAEKRRGGRRWWLLVLAGVLAGLAVGVKFTGLAALALLGLIVLVRIIEQPSWLNLRAWLGHGLILVALALVVYVAGWWAHFALLSKPGPGDAWSIPTGHFVQDTITLHRTMLSANYNLRATHPDASPWWTWPWMRTSVFYWQGDGPSYIYFLGNPVVWWGGSVVFIFTLVSTATSRILKLRGAGQAQKFPMTNDQFPNDFPNFAKRLRWARQFSNLSAGSSPQAAADSGFAVRPRAHGRGKFRASNFPPAGRLWIPIAGYVISYAPLVLVPRALFLYHYLTPLIFSIIVGVLWLDRIGFSKTGTALGQRAAYYIVIGLIIVSFVYFSPITYGFTADSTWLSFLFWLPDWR